MRTKHSGTFRMRSMGLLACQRPLRIDRLLTPRLPPSVHGSVAEGKNSDSAKRPLRSAAGSIGHSSARWSVVSAACGSRRSFASQTD